MQNGESLLGLLKRLAEAGPYYDFEDFQDAHGIKYGRSLLEDPEKLAEITGMDRVGLDRVMPCARPSQPALAWSYHRMHRDPVCPKCLEEGLPRKAEWRHSLVSACAAHGFRLIDECTACGEDLSVSASSHLRCFCGVPFAKTPPTKVSEAEILISKYLAGQRVEVFGRVTNATDDPGVIACIWFLAAGFRTKRTGKCGKTAVPVTINETREFLRPVGDILTNWPEAFDRHVMDRWHAGVSEGISASYRLGSWYRALKALKGPAAAALFQRCEQVLARQTCDPYKLGAADESSEWMTAAAAADELGIRAERLVEAVRVGALEGAIRDSVSGHRHTVVSRASVIEAGRIRALSVTKRDAKHRLGVSRKQFELLDEAGVLVRRQCNGPNPCLDDGYDLTEIEALRERLQGAARGMDGGEAATVAFRDINLRRTTDRAGLLSLYRAISDLEFRPVHIPENGLMGDILFDRDEVDSFLRDAGAGRDWTVSDVATFTGWKPECISHWCREGLLLASHTSRRELKTWQITPTALAEFTRTFSVVSDLAKDADTSSRAILKSLEAAGIATLGVKTAGSTSRGHLVRHTDLMRLAMLRRASA